MKVKQLDPKAFEKYDALIFDCDGTLVDTMPNHYKSWVATLDKYGIPFNYERFYSLAGVPTVDIVALLSKEYDQTVDPEKVAQEKDEHFHQHLAEAKPIQEVINIARIYLGEKKMAVASGSRKWSVHQLLKGAGIYEWFPVIITAEDVENPKPSPDVFLSAAHALQVAPVNCVVFEDAELGIDGALAAGMDAVNILNQPCEA